MMLAPLWQQGNAEDHKNRDHARGSKPAQRQAVFHPRFGQQIAQVRAQRTSQNEREPEQTRVVNFREEIQQGHYCNQPEEQERSISEAGFFAGPVSYCRAERVREDRQTLSHTGRGDRGVQCRGGGGVDLRGAAG